MNPFVILLLYNLIAFTIISLLLVACKKGIRKDSTKDLILKLSSIIVILIHYSSLYVDYFTNQGTAIIEDNMLFPIYPCNILMWLLLIVSLINNKETKVYKYLSEFTFIGGTICGIIGVVFNINFLNDPNISNYNILKGLLSHWVMIFGAICLFLFKFVKIEVKRTMISIIIGSLIFFFTGITINLLYKAFNLHDINVMFIFKAPFEQYPFINFYTIEAFLITTSFIGLNIYEAVTLPKEERWLTKIRKK